MAQGDQVALELDWRGTLALPAGNLPAGTPVRVGVASFLTFAGGLIVKHVDYPLGLPAGWQG